MDAIFRIEPLEETALTHTIERTATIASYFRYRLRRLTILHRHLRGRSLDDNCRPRKMMKVDHAHPAVGGVSHIDPVPSVVLVLRVRAVGSAVDCQVLYSRVFQSSVGLNPHQTDVSQLLRCHGKRHIKLDETAVFGVQHTSVLILRRPDSRYRPGPLHIYFARMPAPIVKVSASAEVVAA